MAHPVRYDVDEHIAVLTLDRPETRNALSDDVLDELLAALERARGDGDVRVVVLASSHEKIFSAGGDLKAFASETPTNLSCSMLPLRLMRSLTSAGTTPARRRSATSSWARGEMLRKLKPPVSVLRPT